MEEELHDNINFLRSAYLLTKETGEPFKMDGEIIKMLLDFLEKVEDDIMKALRYNELR